MEPPSPPVLRAFGGVAAVGPSGPVDLGGPKQRAVLALLLLEPGVTVPLDRIVDRIWGDAPPARAEVSVRGYVSNLRKALAGVGFDTDAVIEFRDRGYVLSVPAESVDLHRFEAEIDDALRLERMGDLAAARDLLLVALGRCTGPALGSVADDLELTTLTAHYDERRAEAVEALAAVRLALGEHDQLPAALAPEIDRYPYRERLRARLAMALYRCGRPVEALRSIDHARRILVEEVGVDPGPELRDLEAAILAHDDTVLSWRPPAGVSASATVALTVEPTTPPIEEDPRRFGRAAEEAQARSVLDRLPTGGGVLVVSGEAGIGKSTLLHGLRAEAQRRGRRVGWDRCPESAAGAPYRSWLSAVAGVVPGGDVQAEARRPEQEAAGALLATHLGELDRLRDIDGPAVIVIDDLQWADDATLSLLEFLAPELEQLPLVLAVGVRRAGSAELAPAVRDCLAELARTSDPVHLSLAGLGADDIADWATSVIGARPSSSLLGYLVETTSGNPFFIRELLALLEADGRLTDAFDGSAPGAVPHAVQDVVRRRTSRLPPDTQALLTVAAVIGRRFDLDLLAVVLDLALPDALARLEPALDDGLVETDDEAAGRFAFSHALVSSTLVAEQNAARLAAHHARITDALERLQAADLAPWVEELAHHASAGLLAGTAPKAFDYAVRAAAIAEAAQSTSEVALQLKRAAKAAAVMPAFPGGERRELLRRLGIAQRDSGDIAGRATLIEAARLAEAQDDGPALAAILGSLDSESLWSGYDWNLYDPRVVAAVERARSRAGLSDRDRTLLTMALAGELTYLDNQRSNVLFAEAHAVAEMIDDPVLSARVLLHWYWSVSGPSGQDRRAAIGDRLIAMEEEGVLPDRLRPLAHLSRVSAALEVSDGDLARRCIDRARALAHPVRTPTGWAHLLFAEAAMDLLDGNLERARARVVALRPALLRVRRFVADSSPASILAVVDTEAGLYDDALDHLEVFAATPYAEPIAWLRAWILAEAGRLDDAGKALAAFDGPLPDDWLKMPLTTAALHAAAAVGDERFLRRHLPSLEPIAEDRFVFLGDGGLCLGPACLAVAAARCALGEPDAARPHAERALALAERMGAVLWIPRARRLLDALSPA